VALWRRAAHLGYAPAQAALAEAEAQAATQGRPQLLGDPRGGGGTSGGTSGASSPS
jgi:hypothetical protein